MQAVAADPASQPFAATKVPQNTKHPFYEFWQSKTQPNYKIERYGGIYGGISSQPWAQTVGWPGRPLFFDQRVYEPNFPLFSVSFGGNAD